MNRREFVKMLAGIPLLGLLTKLPKRKPSLIRPIENWYIGDPESEWHTMVYEGNRLISDDDPSDAFDGGMGKTIWVDLVSGDDANDGFTPHSPITWEKAWGMTEPRKRWIRVL